MRIRSALSLLAFAFAPALAVAAPMKVVPAMPLGAPTAAPVGFTDLCQRQPIECVDGIRGGDIDASQAARLAEVRQWAGQARWAALFGRTTAELSEAPASASAYPGYVSRPLAPRSSATLFEPIAPTLVDEEATEEMDPAVIDAAVPPAEEEPPPPIVSQLSERELERINTQINRSIRRSDDYAAYGRADYWAAGVDHVKRGDCEDYALAKRRALIDAGAPGEALSIAIVRTFHGEMHAVLLVATNEGEVVLDNLSPWIVPWNEAPYQWLDRQAPGAPTKWVHVGVGMRS
ncbi:transglutaminase-like cysteine peptidase [Caulobacter sp. BE254]|uniref:transglutaminase-like cysteine peptidase n=1 Tax=Caulobacter sp. BE254 TaxID=2817720 RepID=UPI0028571D51|nr:transglutaminase-like cysteine peptidase [Caulobacter sp. BE254]MDR7115020.1 putative transglutaminase-like cysteine proteinase [Caulobacter sp. BE254]